MQETEKKNNLYEAVCNIASNVRMLKASIEADIIERDTFREQIIKNAVESDEEVNTDMYINMFLPIELKMDTYRIESNRLVTTYNNYCLDGKTQFSTEVLDLIDKAISVSEKPIFKMQGDKVVISDKTRYNNIVKEVEDSFKNGYLEQWREIFSPK